MSAQPFQSQFGRHSLWSRIPCVCSAFAIIASPAFALAQDQAVLDVLAGVLAVEDARVFDAAVLGAATNHPEPMVRRRAALAMGRIGDSAALHLLLELLKDPAPVVRQDAAFALGLIGDTAALDPLRELVLSTASSEQGPTHREAVTAIARMEKADAAEFYEELLVRWVGRAIAGEDMPGTITRALVEAWRLGERAPVDILAQFAESSDLSASIASLYSLMRLQAPAGAHAFVRSLESGDRYGRAIAARALTASYADSAGLDRGGTARRIATLVEDSDPHVRINALRSLGTYGNAAYVSAVANGLSDSDPNARVQALATLGQLGGANAERLLIDNLKRGTFAERTQSLMGLARVARDTALVHCAAWIISDDLVKRLVGIEALGVVGGDTARSWLVDLAHGSDARIAGRALSALAKVDTAASGRVARDLILHADPIVRATAARHIRDAPRGGDVDLLAESYDSSLKDDVSDARIEIVRAIAAIAASRDADRAVLEEGFLRRFPTCDDYLVRRVAHETFPAAASLWGAVGPVETGRNQEDYRDIARRLVLPAEQDGELPGLVIETELGDITVSLFAAEAPITVDALLQLADRNYFDGGIWHRVVPNFVIQDGDPRGDGSGGPGFSLRDENSRRRYGRGTVGMALAGPDTGGSQFFITHSAQPHLNGTYSVVGQVDQGMDVVDRITLGDKIRTIRRR